MKKHITTAFKYFVLPLLLLVATTKTFAGSEDESIEKKKTYSKTYPLTASQKVSIKNSFGSVVINNYKGSEVKVEVTVVAKASNDDRAQNILDNININDNAGSTVSFETKIDGKNNNRGRKGESQSMEINYVVYMPEGNPLTLQNEFGKSTVPDRSGLTDITQKFGELTVGSLSNVDEIRVEFGSIVADKLAGGKTTFKYSEVKVKSFSGAVKSSLEFCSKTRFGLSNDVTDVNISNSYSDIQINFPESFNATYDIHTSFGDFDNNTSFKIKTDDGDDREPKFDKDYSGKSGSGACKVRIRSSFGKIRFN